jgi:hypothetical protein
MDVHLMGVVCVEAFRIFNLGFWEKVPIPHRKMVTTNADPHNAPLPSQKLPTQATNTDRSRRRGNYLRQLSEARESPHSAPLALAVSLSF